MLTREESGLHYRVNPSLPVRLASDASFVSMTKNRRNDKTQIEIVSFQNPKPANHLAIQTVKQSLQNSILRK